MSRWVSTRERRAFSSGSREERRVCWAVWRAGSETSSKCCGEGRVRGLLFRYVFLNGGMKGLRVWFGVLLSGEGSRVRLCRGC